MPLIKKKFPGFRNDPKAYFANCVKKYLHFVLFTTTDSGFVEKLTK